MTGDRMRRWGRREVLKLAAAGVAGGWLAGTKLARGAVRPPSERIAIASIGVGIMGSGHLRCLLGYREVQVVAICDPDRWRRENARDLADRTYGEERKSGRYRGCRAYRDLREMLARDDIDAVLIATPDHWHIPAAILAAEAGKDIYCEKPLSLTIRQARAAVDVARRYDRVFQSGHQQRSTPDFLRTADLVRQGRIGRVKEVFVNFPGTNEEVNLPAEPIPKGLDWNQWLGPAPWRPYHSRFHHYGPPPHVVPWHFCRDFGAGNLTSNAVHSFDSVQQALGRDGTGPVEITPPGVDGAAALTYRYADGVRLTVEWKLDPARDEIPRGWDPATRLQNFGALLVGEEGWIHVGRHGYLTSFPASIVGPRPDPPRPVSPIPDHHHNWFACIRARERPRADVAFACRSVIVSHLGGIAHWTGRKLRWDPEREEFPGDDEANRLRSRALREPWHL